MCFWVPTSTSFAVRHGTTSAALYLTTGTVTAWDPNPFPGAVMALTGELGGTVFVGGSFHQLGGQYSLLRRSHQSARRDRATVIVRRNQLLFLGRSEFNSQPSPVLFAALAVSGSNAIYVAVFPSSRPADGPFLFEINLAAAGCARSGTASVVETQNDTQC
jgi:hypothetical protein